MKNKNSNRKILWIIIFVQLLIIAIGSCFLIPKVIDKFNNKSNESNEEEKEKEKEKITPLMYEITKEGSKNKIYLFGSIHAANAYELEFPNYLIDAFNDSDYLACEFDSTNNTEYVYNDLDKYYYSDNSTIKDHMSKESYETLINFLKQKNYYNHTYEKFKLFVLYSLVENILAVDSSLSVDQGIDPYFINKAKNEGKTILEVESYDYQINLFFSYPDRLYEVLIVELINNYDKYVKGIKEEYESWKIGDDFSLEEELEEEKNIENDKYSQEDIDMFLDYNNKLTKERNITMADKLEEYFNSNKRVFFMVGTAHLIGEDGIANLLEQRGYIVTKLNK